MSAATAVSQESHASEPFKVASNRTSQLFPEAHDHSGANPQIVLPVVETIRQSGHKALGLQGPNSREIGVDIKARVVVSAVQIKL
jgi:hypothetical protein